MKAGTQTLILCFPTTAAQRTYSLTLQAILDSLIHSIPFAFQLETQTLAGFSVVLNSTELSFAQESGAFTTVGLSQRTDENANYDVAFSIKGLPSGCRQPLPRSRQVREGNSKRVEYLQQRSAVVIPSQPEHYPSPLTP
jgi:hypothetical protein